MRCTGPGVCSGAVALAHVAPRRVTRLGGTVAHLRPDSAKRVTVTLGKRTAPLVRRSRRRHVRVQVEARTASGGVERLRTTVRLAAPAQR